jgi:DNA end-binding protein Ku
MRAMRNLVLTLGDVAVPVGLAAAVREPDDKMFRVLHRECETPISMRVWCPLHERVLEPDETVTAWQMAPGQFVPLDDEELVALRPADSSIVPISGFIPAGEIDQLLVKKRYRLTPNKTNVGLRGYRTLAAAIHGQDVVALTRFTAWSSEQLAAVSSRDGDALELATLHFLDDLVPADDLYAQIAKSERRDVDVDLMRQIVERYTRRLKPDDLASERRPLVQALLEGKLSGAKIELAAVEQPQLPAIDLEDALRATLKAAPRKRARKPAPA